MAPLQIFVQKIKMIKKNQKQLKKKEKNYPSQPATTTSPVKLHFFWQNIYTCITFDSNRLTPASRVPSLPLHYTSTCDFIRYDILLN